MKKKLIVSWIVIVILIVVLPCLFAANRYQCAIYWIEEGNFSKASSYVDEFPFIISLYDPGFVSYTYAGEEMDYGHYDEAIRLLIPLADKNYRNSAKMLNYCMEQIAKLPD